MAGRHSTRTTVISLLVETFFAVLPLIVLGSIWTKTDESFWSGPEVSMTSCILYGLTLAKLFQAAVYAAVRSSTKTPNEMHELASVYAGLTLVPLLGAIVSVIFITKSMQASGTWIPMTIRILNLVAAVAIFFWLGGYSMNLAEGSEISNDLAK